MEKKTKLSLPGGKQVEGIEMDFTAKKEEWNEYELSEGSTVRIKLVITNIVKTNDYDNEGNPIYMVKSTNVVSVSVPQHLKKSLAVS